LKVGEPMLKHLGCVLCVAGAALAAPLRATSALAQTSAPQSQVAAAETTERNDEGIPVTSDLVKRKCGTCHQADEKGRLSRISYRRTTPEGWEQTIKRMITLNNVAMEPAEARDVVRYLADRHGLAPEEAKAAAFEVERRLIEYVYAGDKDTNELCTTCHSMGRVISQRRTKEEWTLLLEMHRAIYPGTDTVFRRVAGRRQPAPAPGSPPPDNRHPMEKAIAHLSTAFPLTTPEWAAWSATMRPPPMEGRWAVAGYQPGRGPVFGQVTVTAQGAPGSGDFTTETTFSYARGGQTVTRRGRALVYTGFQWRGRSSGDATAFPIQGVSTDWREVLFVDRNGRQAEGRWFTGGYNEFGIDVRLDRIGSDPIVMGTAESMIKTGTSRQELHLYGANLPSSATPADVHLGPGVTIDRVVSATPTQMVVSVSVAPDAPVGRRNITIAGSSGDASLAVYNTIDFLKVTPQSGIARLGGGAAFPKQYQQFDAIAYARGPDGKPDTKDDVELGRVDALWTIEEFTATFNDDDKEFVGQIDAETGLFTPNIDGPNPKRKNNANNYGDVWVVATYPRSAAQDGGAKGRSVKGRAHLLVTVPAYILFDQPEVAR
jgi:quinohemoprotein amine dehydrogenase